ncbi:ankyrin repeat and KH domain-containing protein 1-like [Sycon ciliatum]|uniref:ankyrin repeat and KH domain-containing protein 1-like n=1 Tax=Sycon ciliatum TaxID=27933 RepID=UPI0031F61523
MDVHIPHCGIGRVIGRGGCNISELHHTSGALVKVNRKGSTEATTPFTISGSHCSCKIAIELINAAVGGGTKLFRACAAAQRCVPQFNGCSIWCSR